METLKVEQCDRDVVADYLFEHGGDWGFCGDVREGRIEHPLVSLLSAHRIAERERCAGIAEKLRAVADSDHKRGCQGREYTCTCGFDDERDVAIAQAIREQSNGA